MKTNQISYNDLNKKTADAAKKKISLSERKVYNQMVLESYQGLSSMSSELSGLIINLTRGDEWNQEQPIGTKTHLNENAIRNSADKNIDILLELKDAIEKRKEQLMEINSSLAASLQNQKEKPMQDEASKRFNNLMKRKPNPEKLVFTDEEITFMGKHNLVAFCKKFPGEAEWYMQD